MRRIFIYLIALLSYLPISAQGPAISPSQASAMMAKQSHQTSMFNFSSKKSGSVKSDYANFRVMYFVLKRDSSGMNVKSKIYVTDKGRFYLLNENENSGDDDIRIYADETIKINFQDQRLNKLVEGTTVGSAWLFKVEEGKISLYSHYPTPLDVLNECLSAFQFGDSEIEPLSIERLKEIMQNNKKALEALEKKDYLKAVRRFNKE